MKRTAYWLTLVLFATAANADDPERGKSLFADHCATCHGTNAMGNGPMAPVMAVRPSDLTKLSAGNGGTFPLDRVVRRIDGTTEVLAHGGPMPLFGLLLQGPSVAILAPDGSELIAPEAIVDIATWLQSIQGGS
ncbi:c-type cytochrome [Silicimonas sp. MF1-12-2]|uniref:c-type cytochrome n=1 Tax=Silicimonas sp. MF1-12-2 TaxID=3384793 RepID=UPI0039B47234